MAKTKKPENDNPTPPTACDIFEGLKGRLPKSDQELNEWLASDEGKAATMFELSTVSPWGEVGRS